MGRIFAFVTFLCLSVMIVIGLVSPNDPLFLFAAKGPVALIVRVLLAVLMLGVAFGYQMKLPKIRYYLGAAGFVLISLGVLTLASTEGSGIYPLLQPADLLTAVVIGVTFSIVALETAPATVTIVPDRYFFYQEDDERQAPTKRLKATARHKHA